LVDEFFGGEEDLGELYGEASFGCRREIAVCVAIMICFANEGHVEAILGRQILDCVWQVMDESEQMDERFVAAVVEALNHLGRLLMNGATHFEPVNGQISAERFLDLFESCDPSAGLDIVQNYPFFFTAE
jgi:hypothetical protein